MIDNNIVMVLFFILLFILIVVIVYNYYLYNNIEKFSTPAILPPTYRIPDSKVVIASFTTKNDSFDANSYFNTVNISDTCISSSPENKQYIAVSSFNYSEGTNSPSLLVTLNSANNMNIRLQNSNTKNSYFKKIVGQSSTAMNGGNYIAIFFQHSKLLLNNLTITATMKNTLDTTVNNIQLFSGNGLQDDSYLPLPTVNTMSDNSIILTVIEKDNFYIDETIIIYFPPEVVEITLRSLKFIFNTVEESADEYDSSRTDIMDTETSLPDTGKTPYENTDFTNIENFMKAFYFQVPDFIYDFDTVSTTPKQFSSFASAPSADGSITKIQDIFGRFSHMNTISGENPKIAYEYDNNNNMYGTYLKGSSRTSLLFPPGTIPNDYTICCVTKYEDTTGNRTGNTGRVISADSFNFLIGHWSERERVIYNERAGGWINYHNNVVSADTNSRKWIVTCIKSSGNINVIINNNVIAGQRGGSGINEARLVVNGGRFPEVSDFGIKYLFVWKKSLRDDVFKLISDGLNGMITSGKNYFNIQRAHLKLNLKDGSSPSNAADSAREIKQLYGTEKNGFYYIKTPGKKPIYTYCIMDSACHGGGWMLALQGARNSTRFVYRSSFWTAENVLNSIETANDIPDPNPALRGFVNPSTGDPILENIIDAKYHIYNYYKGTDCMALFPGSHTNGNRTRISGKPQYGWNWVTNGAFGRYRDTTLLDFFRNNRRCYQYASIRNNFTRQQSDRSDEGEKITMDYMRQTLDREMPLGIWARQTTYFSYGLNITLSRSAWWASQINGPSLHPHNHQVRWGAVFNENDGDDWSPDVSGGIGLDISQDTRNIFANTYHPHSSAGNRTSCCAVAGSPGSYGMSFQWYIR